jgi:hypothetical protein
MSRIQKTPTEIKSERFARQYAKARNPKSSKPKRKKKVPLFEPIKVLRTLSYSAFLQTKYWAHVRGIILKRDNHKCVICKSDKGGLQVHHDTYKNHCNELQHLADLITLCAGCHKEHHYAQGV